MDEKEAFLDEYGGDYGYPNGPKSIDQIRATEFKRLDASGTVYLDHAGATLYSELQMEAIFKDLTGSLYGNPHSQSESSSVTSDIIREARQQVLDYFNASPKEYRCIFTSGATAALKLVGEYFPWSSKSSFMYTMENHNSVLGIREYALGKGAAAFAVDTKEGWHHDGESRCPMSSLKISQHPVQRRNQAGSVGSELRGDAYNLFAFPSECNFSGSRFNLDLVKNIRENAAEILEGSPFSKGHWMILIDAAKGCAAQPPDLSVYPADFVVMSFYKLFGYPTGLGALIVRNDAAKLLKKTYFSGGTVAASIADIDFVKRREGVEELFEDGTSSFLSIASLRHGFNILNSLTTSAMYRHTSSLAIYVKKKLLSLRHKNGTGVCTVYGSHTLKVSCHDSGPTVSFNLKRPDGSWFGYREVEKLASLSGIQLRTGCFCNPGACAKYLDLSHSDLLSNIEAGHICWDDNDVIHGKPTGAVRVSFGYMSTFEDAKKFVDFIGASFISIPHKQVNGFPLTPKPFRFHCKGIESIAGSGYSLKSITIYPIKSCGGFSVESWPLSRTGLRHDREWLIKSLTGEILTQKKVPEMSLISTFIDPDTGMMYVTSSRCKTRLPIKLVSNSNECGTEDIHIHGQRYESQRYNSEINQWFSDAVGRPCELLRCSHFQYCSPLSRKKSIECCRDVDSPMSFANEGHFLLISEESVSDLNNRLRRRNTQKGTRGAQAEVAVTRFRPNLVISGGEPYIEDGWTNLKIGEFRFTSLGGCNRCQMINIVHQAEQIRKSNEPLATLASYRRVKGKILFGILLRLETGMDVELDQNTRLQVGDQVYPDSEC